MRLTIKIIAFTLVSVLWLWFGYASKPEIDRSEIYEVNAVCVDTDSLRLRRGVRLYYAVMSDGKTYNCYVLLEAKNCSLQELEGERLSFYASDKPFPFFGSPHTVVEAYGITLEDTVSSYRADRWWSIALVNFGSTYGVSARDPSDMEAMRREG